MLKHLTENVNVMNIPLQYCPIPLALSSLAAITVADSSNVYIPSSMVRGRPL